MCLLHDFVIWPDAGMYVCMYVCICTHITHTPHTYTRTYTQLTFLSYINQFNPKVPCSSSYMFLCTIRDWGDSIWWSFPIFSFLDFCIKFLNFFFILF